jgi:pectate lyase
MSSKFLMLFCGIIVLSILSACSQPSPTLAPTVSPTLAPTQAKPTDTPKPAATATTQPAAKRDLGRETLTQNDGWAAQGTGTTGGTSAAPDHVYTVHNRKELIAALNDGKYPPPSTTPSNAAKIIYVDGVIDLNVDDNGKSLNCQDYNRSGYTIQAYVAAFDPATWGKKVVSGTLETARVASQQAQEERVRVRVGSNTTIVGVGKSATIRGAWLDMRGTASAPLTNIIIRNITFQDTYDCFPQWDPTDGADGNWNSLYDSISLRYVDHLWADHNSFEDRDTPDSKQPSYFTRLFQIHDGELDITNASDLVTVSWNRFLNHDKVMLIGSSDTGNTAAGDRGKLRVTLHHNYFDNVGQRVPRVRFGQVHVYNNYYKIVNNPNYGYSWGVGIESQIYAENNYFKTDDKISPKQIIGRYSGTAIQVSGTRVNDSTSEVDVLAANNAANDTKLDGKVSWTPTFVTKVDPVERVISTVESDTGPLSW